MYLKKNMLQPGFNFIELMVALVIIGIIVGMIGPRVATYLGRSRRSTTENSLKIMKDAIKQYNFDTGTYPTKLEDLIKKPEGINGWQGPYVGDEDKANPELPKDYWSQDFVYKLNERGAKPPFDLYSLGDPEKDDDRIYAK